jgi:hypothetical protein
MLTQENVLSILTQLAEVQLKLSARIPRMRKVSEGLWGCIIQ